MIRLRLLGSLALFREDGSPIRSLLAQPKRFALLAYLAAAPSPAVHRRDTLLGLFWPELDAEHARQALRQALYGLRRSLGPGLIVGEGDELVSIDAQQMWCDATAFTAAIKEGREQEALELYRGSFLEGFHLSGAPAFERWVEGEGRRFRLHAVHAAWRLVARAANDRSEARRWAEYALELAPFDEEGLRRYLALMVEHGQPAVAVRTYDAYAERLAVELELEPSAETVALVERIRAGERAAGGSEFPRSAVPPPAAGPRAAMASPTEFSETPGPESGAPAPVVVPSRLGRFALLAAPAVVVLGWALLLLHPGGKPPAPAKPTTYPPTALAVLPFQNLSSEPGHAYFAGGLHDELLTQLSKVAALSVRGRSSVMGYAGTTKSVRQIAEELAVGALVEGSVQVVGDRLRVNVQLIDAATDEHLWAEGYDRTLDDAFEIQSDVAQRVVAAVGAALGATERYLLTVTPTTNPDAYRLYLQGRDYSRRAGWQRQDFETAQQLYERALTLDPAFAPAYAALAEAHGVMHWFRYDLSPARMAEQREAAEAALQLAPELPQAHFAMGQWHYWGRRDYERALAAFEIALRGLPKDARVWAWIAWVNRRLGNWGKVYAAFERAAELDPRDATLFADVGGLTYRFTKRYSDAMLAFERALALAPDLAVAAVERAWTYVEWQGRLDTLRAVLARLPRDAELSWLGSAAAQRAELLLWEREPDRLALLLASTPTSVLEGHDFFLPKSLYAAWAHRLRGDQVAARLAFDSAIVVLGSAIRELPEDWRLHAARGLAVAGLGRRAEALREARWLAQSAVYRDDAFQGARVAEDRARILAQVGATDEALNEIERLLARPSKLTVHTLRLDPRWDPIREHPRFRALVARYGSP